MLIDNGRRSRIAGAAGTGVGVAVGAGRGVGFGVGLGFGVEVGIGVVVGDVATECVAVGEGADFAAVAAEPQEANKTLMTAIQRTAGIAFFRVFASILRESVDNESKAWYSIGTFLRKKFQKFL